MLEFTDKGNINWLLKKREIASSYYMESVEVSRKRKGQDFLANDELFKGSEENVTASSFDQKRKRLGEDSTNMNNNVEEGYYHNHKSLDLELNLSTSFIDLNHHHDLSKNDNEDKRKKTIMDNGSVLGLQTEKNMAWVAFDLDSDGCDRRSGGVREEEMVARVCMKCHMLVMLCKASPACPNCKFMHSPEDTSISLLFTPKPTLLA
ncbi:hypothetical protein V5N11_020193 [Cardamine amara subsp. amara]|uniref:Uncharacterized protein n=1 Tax=Cardamine amara subsp. amara TaxID=228776 RepID=A0ABD1C501_CARAN